MNRNIEDALTCYVDNFDIYYDQYNDMHFLSLGEHDTVRATFAFSSRALQDLKKLLKRHKIYMD